MLQVKSQNFNKNANVSNILIHFIFLFWLVELTYIVLVHTLKRPFEKVSAKTNIEGIYAKKRHMMEVRFHYTRTLYKVSCKKVRALQHLR